MLSLFKKEGLESHQKSDMTSMKGNKTIFGRVCEGVDVFTREIDEINDGGDTMLDECGRDGFSVLQN